MTTHPNQPETAVSAFIPASPVQPRTAGRPRSPVVSRGQIADGVVDLICERGLHGWSMRDLAAHLGLSTGTIRYYFRDKQALLFGAMDAVYVLPADWREYRDLPPAARLRHITEMFVLDNERKQRWGRFWLAYLAGAGHDTALRERQEERYERQRRFFARLIAAGLAERGGVPHLDAEHEATRLVALGSGLAVQQIATPDAVSPAAARAVLETYLVELQVRIDRRDGEG